MAIVVNGKKLEVSSGFEPILGARLRHEEKMTYVLNGKFAVQVKGSSRVMCAVYLICRCTCALPTLATIKGHDR